MDLVLCQARDADQFVAGAFSPDELQAGGGKVEEVREKGQARGIRGALDGRGRQLDLQGLTSRPPSHVWASGQAWRAAIANCRFTRLRKSALTVSWPVTPPGEGHITRMS